MSFGPTGLRSVDLVAVVARNRCIGRGLNVAWHPDDFARFQALTMGHTVVLGRTTWDAIGQPPPGRQCIIVTRNADLVPNGAVPFGLARTALSLEAALSLAFVHDSTPKVVGGGQIFRLALPLASRLYLMRVDQDVPGCDAHFPEFEGAFVLAASEPGVAPGVTFTVWTRAAVGGLRPPP